MKLPSNKTTPFLKALVYHNLLTSVLHSFGLVHNLQLSKIQSLTCIKVIQERLTNNNNWKP